MVLTTVGGYLCRRLAWVSERTGERLMTLVAVFGYPVVGFFSVWGLHLKPSDAALPILAVVQVVLMTFLSLAMAPWFTEDRAERGLFAVAGGLGNNGFTMGAFVLYLLYGEDGMGLANVYFIAFIPLVVVLFYPLARHFASAQPAGSLGRLILRSLLDWRSLGLPASIVAVILSASGVPRPVQVSSWRLLDILVFTITPLAFFGIGLRLHLSKIRPLVRILAGLALVRFVLGAILGLGLAWLSQFTPWPLADLRWKIFVVEGFVPTAVTMVAVANMFGLRPREASVLFVVNTVLYLALVLPLVLWIFG
jgi:predicted permease